MAKAQAIGKSAQPKKKGSFGLKILGFLLLVLGMMVLPSSLLIAVGMVPTAVAWVIDLDPRKTAATAVGPVNACGVLPFEITLWQGANSVPHAMQIISQPETWAIMYGAAAVGWVIYYTVPPLVSGFIAYHAASRSRDLEARQAELREAWGNDVAG